MWQKKKISLMHFVGRRHIKTLGEECSVEQGDRFARALV